MFPTILQGAVLTRGAVQERNSTIRAVIDEDRQQVRVDVCFGDLPLRARGARRLGNAAARTDLSLLWRFAAPSLNRHCSSG